MSPQDKESLDLYLKQGEQLAQQHKQLNIDKSFHTASQLLCLNDNQTLPTYQSTQLRNWINILHDYHNTANYLEAPQIKDYLNSAHNECVHFDQFDEPTFIKLKTKLLNVAQSLKQLPRKTVHTIANKVKQFSTNSKQHLITQREKYTNQLALIHHNLMVVDVDKQDSEYNPEDDIKGLPNNERVARRTKGVVTRSMAKQHAKQQKLKKLREQHPDSNDPLIKAQEKEFMQGIYDHLNAEYNRQKFRTKTREEFLFDIFGHRRDLDIFNTKTFINYQENDAITSVAKKLITGDSKDLINDEDFHYLMNVDPGLAGKIEIKKVRIKDKILQVKHKISDFDGEKWLKYVPFVIRGRMMDYAHHNLQLHHFNHIKSLNQIKHKYWWSTMKKDMIRFCELCISCQFIKGSVRHRAPLRIRELPAPRAHIFADFLGSIYGKYYILVLVDYATGYTMLIPTTNTDMQN